MTHHLRRFGPLLVFLAAALWATDAPFRFHLVQELPVGFIVLAEHFVSVLLLLPLLFISWHQIKRLSPKAWAAVLVIAIGGSALAAMAFTAAFQYVNPSVAILLQKLQPLIAISLAVTLLRERLGKQFWLWAIVALIGGYLVSFPDLVPRTFEGEVFNPNVIGILLALVAAVLWGASTVFGRYVLKTIEFKAMTALRFVLAFLFLLIFNLANGSIPPLATVSGKSWLFIVIVALVSGFVALLIYYRGLAHTKASIATIAEMGFVVMAVVVNAIFLDAFLNPVQILGGVLLLGSVFMLARINR